MEVSLGSNVDITVKPAETVQCGCLNVERIVDLPIQRQVRVFVRELNRPILLWSGDEYCEWTKADVETRLAAMASTNAIVYAS